MKIITLKKMMPGLFVPAVLCFLALSPNRTMAQNFCNNEATIWSQNFGTGTTSSSNPEVLNLSYQANGVMNTAGTYRVINMGDQNPNWHKTFDHTPNDIDGKMIVIEGQAGDFYAHTEAKPNGYPAGYYSFNFWALNLMGLNNCGVNSIKPVLRTKAEYRDINGNWIELIGSPITSAPIAETNTPVWIHLGGIFTLPTTGNFQVTEIRCTISDLSGSGCGNDFAIDDIKLTTCSDNGTVPVSFLAVTARQKGSGVNVDWSTASESNSDYFEVEKSTDGASWSVVANVKAVGNSSITKYYGGYDAKPSAGLNYYRIKQVDKNGTFKYSVVVPYNLKIVSTTASVLANPFRSNITVDFLSTGTQVVNSKLFDVSGKVVIAQQLSLSKGSSRKVIDAANNLNRGMYILQITDVNGVIIYNDKLIKQ